MNRAVPTITESAEALKLLLKAEDDAKRAQRLQVLYLFASQQVKTRKEAAAIRGGESRDNRRVARSVC